ncbi:MAG TPA: DUF4232 domain-containing protein [Streptomyces sp.]
MRAFARVRGPLAAALFMAGALTLPGCSGFLVPAGEGEPAPTPTPVSTPTPDPALPDGLSAPSASAQDAPTPSAAPAGCSPSGVRVDMGEVETAMFARAVVLTLTNCGKAPYQVHGYPSVQALGEHGERIPVKVNPAGSMFGDDLGPQRVTLKPGGTVRSVLAWVSTQEGGDLIEGDALEIAPATGTEARVFPLEGHDLRLMDELNMTAWRSALPE